MISKEKRSAQQYNPLMFILGCNAEIIKMVNLECVDYLKLRSWVIPTQIEKGVNHSKRLPEDSELTSTSCDC